MNGFSLRNPAVLAVFATILLLLIGSTVAFVPETRQAVVVRFGQPVAIYNPYKTKEVFGQTGAGLKIRMPLFDQVVWIDKRIQSVTMARQQVLSTDQLRLQVDAFARYRITDPLRFYQTVRDERMVRSRLGPIVESSIRRVLGATTFSDVVRDKREDLMKRIAHQVNNEGKDFGLEVVDVRIKRADLPEQNSKNIFDRMRAERQREAAEFRAEGSAAANRIRATADREATVIKAEATKKGELLRGEGDAERNRVVAEAFGKDPEFFSFYRSMQAYETGIKSGDTRMLLSPDSEFFRYFNAPSGSTAGAQPKK